MEVTTMSWSWAALMPHPPIIVPDVGRGRENEAAITINGVKNLMKRLSGLKTPDRVLLVSPHQPYSVGAFCVNRASVVRGSLAPFGAASPVFDLRTPIAETDSLSRFLSSNDIPVCFNESGDLTRDQGSLVPLYFLSGIFDPLPQTILSSPIGLDVETAFEMGRVLASLDDGHRWALLASGDLSHRLKPGAPAGFSPEGQKFDDAVVDALKKRDASILSGLPQKTIESAGECGLRSVMIMLGLCSELGGAIEVLSYEGPFGVGYCNALFAAR
jgi:aromatic ring-opening dioxygenase LigB subunit